MDLLIPPDELNQKLNSGQPVMVVDVRGADAYRAGHIPGAVHIPGDEISARLSEIPKDRPVVFY